MKKWLAILTAFLPSVPFAVSPAFAAEASLPTEDPNYVEQSLEEFRRVTMNRITLIPALRNGGI